MPRKKETWSSAVLFFMVGLVVVGCGGLELDSRWRGSEAPLIDGALTEWEGRTTYLEKDRVLLGVQNDDRYLYLGLSTGDEYTQRQVLLHGLAVWFDPTGGTRKTFGIRFPLNSRPSRPKANRQRLPDRDGPDLDEVVRRLQGSSAEMEIVDATGGIHRIPVGDAGDLEVAVNRVNGVLVYELKVPLRTGGESVFAVGAVPGVSLGMGFEIQGRKPKGGIGGLGGAMGGRKGGGVGGGRGGFGGGLGRPGLAPGGFGIQMHEPFKIWAKVRLASEKS